MGEWVEDRTYGGEIVGCAVRGDGSLSKTHAPFYVLGSEILFLETRRSAPPFAPNENRRDSISPLGPHDSTEIDCGSKVALDIGYGMHNAIEWTASRN